MVTDESQTRKMNYDPAVKNTDKSSDKAHNVVSSPAPGHSNQKNDESGDHKAGLLGWLKTGFGRKTDEELRQTIEEYIEESSDEQVSSLESHEKTLISNVLKLRDLTANDIMIPRADIVSFDLDQPVSDFLELLSEKPHSRIPVYKQSQDDILGAIHIKDVLCSLAKQENLSLENMVRDVPIISPSLPILDLLLQMRESRKHMALVIDEFGGIDGLVTIGDLIEAIVGEFYDEHDPGQSPKMIIKRDGTIIADARLSIDEFEGKICPVLTKEEHEDIDTLGGLVFEIAGRIPARGEILKHNASGLVFEIIDADPRRINKLRITNISQT